MIRLRTLHLSGSLDTEVGGPPEALAGVLTALSENEASSTVISIKSLNPNAPVLNKIESLHQQVFEVNPAFGLGRYQGSVSFPRLFLKLSRKTDIIIAHGYYSLSLLIAARSKFVHGKPIVVIPHGSLEPYQERRHRFRKLFFKTLLGGTKHIDGFFVATPAESRTLSTHKWIQTPIYVVGLGVGVPNFQSREDDSSWNLQDSYMAFLGRIAFKKRIDIAIMAIDELRRSNVKLDLRVAGEGEKRLTKELYFLVEKLNLSDRVYFEGQIHGKDKLDFLSSAIVSVLPSENENFAVAIAESLSVGTPVIVTQFVALSELVRKFHAGIVIEGVDPKDIAKAFLEIQSNRDYYSTGALLAAESISFKKVGADWVQILENLVNNLK